MKTKYENPEMREAYFEGQRDALLAVLQSTGMSQSKTSITNMCTSLQKLLAQRELVDQRIGEDTMTDIFRGKYQYTPSQLLDFVMLLIRDLQTRLQYARHVHISLTNDLRRLQYLSFEEDTHR